MKATRLSAGAERFALRIRFVAVEGPLWSAAVGIVLFIGTIGLGRIRRRVGRRAA
ncbi:hypothetical protein [Glycomyces sp. YM15]|uniref:hypothetical protein n=1 Tax=Glycomyces sp. YM15 TaxID=2800446 RepID=UPI0019642454|nr:hypothetical protein [Glycomyces sp. YM15]